LNKLNEIIYAHQLGFDAIFLWNGLSAST